MAAAFEGHAIHALQDKDGITALMWAKAKGHQAIARELARAENFE